MHRAKTQFLFCKTAVSTAAGELGGRGVRAAIPPRPRAAPRRPGPGRSPATWTSTSTTRSTPTRCSTSTASCCSSPTASPSACGSCRSWSWSTRSFRRRRAASWSWSRPTSTSSSVVPFNLRAGDGAGAGRRHQRAARAAGVPRRRAAVRRDRHHPDHLVRGRRGGARRVARWIPLPGVRDGDARCVAVRRRRGVARGAAEGRPRRTAGTWPAPGEWSTSGRPGLVLGASVWSGDTGFAFPRVDSGVTLAEADGRFRVGEFAVRGLYAHAFLDGMEDLNRAVARITGVSPNVAEQMRGFYLEALVLHRPAAGAARGGRCSCATRTSTRKYRMPDGGSRRCRRSTATPGFSAPPGFPIPTWRSRWTTRCSATGAPSSPRRTPSTSGWGGGSDAGPSGGGGSGGRRAAARRGRGAGPAGRGRPRSGPRPGGVGRRRSAGR